MKKKKLIYILTPIILILIGIGWYFIYFINTPSYAVNKVREAYQKHDIVTFKRYVDTHAVMDAAFDDIIIAEEKNSNINILNNSFAMGIIKLIKPQIVDLMEDELVKKVATDPSKHAQQAPTQEKQVDPITETLEKNISSRFPADSLTLKDVSVSKQEHGQAICTVTVFNSKTQKNQKIHLLMRVNGKDDWEIYKTKNLVEFLIENNSSK